MTTASGRIGGLRARPPFLHDLRDRLEGRPFPYLLIAPALLTIVLVALVPFIYTIWISLHDAQFTRIGAWTGLSNFGDLLTSGSFWHSMGVTALIVAFAVPLQLSLGLAIALVFHRGVLGGRILSPLILIPSVIAPAVVGIVWKIMLAGTWGLFTQVVLNNLGILTDSSIFSNATAAIIAIIAIDVWQWTPFVALALFAGLQAQPENPYRAAAVDGASRWQTLRFVTLPMLFPLLAVLLLLRLIDTFKIFDTVFILTGGGPGNSTETVSVFLYRQGFDFFNVSVAAAAAVIIFALFLTLATVFYRTFTRRLRLF